MPFNMYCNGEYIGRPYSRRSTVGHGLFFRFSPRLVNRSCAPDPLCTHCWVVVVVVVVTFDNVRVLGSVPMQPTARNDVTIARNHEQGLTSMISQHGST